MRTLSILFFALMGGNVAAQDADLYGPDIPIDAPLLRVVACGDTPLKLNGDTVSRNDCVSEYQLIEKGTHRLMIGEKEHSITANAYDYLTLYAEDKQPVITKDERADDPAKTLVRFYNFTSLDEVTLFATEHNTPLFEHVATHTKAARAINPLLLKVEVQHQGNIRAKAEHQLPPRTGVSFIFIEVGGDYRLIAVADSVSL